ncbi:hypothetical protein OS493_038810 [Desmophyllum pertusum]|uniref:Neurotransmitter-gated ion-channel ligand-binding domain-containing protein n=1 Tax=Desmophyllum pertusum TaxID=174260 RepID=A0A9W9ZUV0_9CNID|nr:hypothetical protein OS493_038810 [Desmophyllum pertusum]
MLLLTCSRKVNCEEDVITKFFSDYDKAVRPILEYKAYIYFRQKWIDSRLVGKLNRTLTIKGAEIENIWVPDPYCYNARESNMMMPDAEIHSSVSIQPSGDVLYSKGVSVLASCKMDLRSFPHDSQSCFLKFGSYSYSTADIVFKWNATDVDVGTEQMAQF